METRKMKVFWTVFFIIMLAAFSFNSTQTVAKEPQGVMKLAVHFGSSADWVDPSLPPADMTRFLPLYFFHDALVKPMGDKMHSPSLAESWTSSQDFKVWEFKLREGVKFHNGDVMTAEDVVFTFQRYKGGNAKFLLDKIDKLEAVSPYLFRISFKEPFIDFLDHLIPGSTSIGWIVPKKYIEKVGDAAYKNNPIGCGPYKFVEFEPGVKLVGEAFKEFWRKEPSVKTIEFHFIREASTRFAMLKRGEVAFASAMGGVFLEQLKKEPSLRVGGGLSPNRWTLVPSAQWDPKSPWNDVRVRKAVSLAIDRQAIVDMQFPGAKTIGSIALNGDPEGLVFPPDPYDPEKAKQLLAEAGYPNGFDGGKFYPHAGGPNRAIGEMLANYMKAIGISTETVLLDRPTFFSMRRSGKMKGGVMMEAIGAGSISARTNDFLTYTKNYGNYPEIDALWEQYNNSIDPEERKALIGQIQTMFSEQVVFISLCENKTPAGFGPRLKGNPYGIQGEYPIWYPTPMEDLELNE